jgi:hypothetical protein
MPGEGVEDRTVGEVAVAMRALLAAIDEGRMSCSRGYRSRLQGAVVALEARAGNARKVSGRVRGGGRRSRG